MSKPKFVEIAAILRNDLAETSEHHSYAHLVELTPEQVEARKEVADALASFTKHKTTKNADGSFTHTWGLC